MISLSSYLFEIGQTVLQFFWFPVLLWTVLALFTLLILRFSSRLPAIVHYHIRIALLTALPAGMLLSIFVPGIGTLWPEETMLERGLYFVESTVSSTGAAGISAESTPVWYAPAFWIAVSSLLVVSISMVRMAVLKINLSSLFRQLKRLSFRPLKKCGIFTEKTERLIARAPVKPLLAFSETTAVPFTAGTRPPMMVIPGEAQSDIPLLHMTVRHELIHILRYDFLVHLVMQVIRGLFWFHPLVHRLYHQTVEYSEISCDHEVLADPSISRKAYAQLLVEMAPRSINKNGIPVGMAVNPSMLKKRIDMIRKESISRWSVGKSMGIALATLILVTGVIACSDLQGPTDEQGQIVKVPDQSMFDDTSPIFIVDGLEITSEEIKSTVSKINPENIKSIEVLKNGSAIDRYGPRAKNGVVKIQLKKSLNMDDMIQQSGSTINREIPWKNDLTPGDSEAGQKLQIYIGKNDRVTIREQTISSSKVYNYLEKLNMHSGVLVQLEVHPDATVGSVTDVQRALRKRGTLRIDYVSRRK